MANTLFHKVKFGIRKAFFICFDMTTTTKSLFMHKILEAMQPNGNHPMDGNVHIDEFVIGGKEQDKVGHSYNSKKKKAVCPVQLTDEGKVKRMYAMKIDN